MKTSIAILLLGLLACQSLASAGQDNPLGALLQLLGIAPQLLTSTTSSLLGGNSNSNLLGVLGALGGGSNSGGGNPVGGLLQTASGGAQVVSGLGQLSGGGGNPLGQVTQITNQIQRIPRQSLPEGLSEHGLDAIIAQLQKPELQNYAK